jgi:tetratricopeptide (TPR) repeat protein
MNLISDRRIAFIAAMLFAVHPIHTEAVAWITDIVDLGCTVFFLLAVFLYTRPERASLVADLAIAACYLTSLLWKEPGATLLLVIVAYDIVVRREPQWRRYVPMAAAAGIYFFLRNHALGGIVPITYRSGMKFSESLLMATAGLGTYIFKLFVPINLSIYYEPVTSPIAYALLLVVALAAAALLWRAHRQISWALLWVVLTLSPALAVSRISMPVSERNLYLASGGYCLAVALILSKLHWRHANVLSACLVGLFAAGTIARLPVWHDDLTLYAATLKKHPDAGIVRMNFATEFARRGRLPEAIEQLDIVLAANPSDAGVLSNKATLKSRQGDWQSVREICSRALSANPKMSACLTLLAATDQQEGNLPAALQKLDQAINIDPRSYEAHYYRGNVYSQMGRLDEAVSDYKLALSARPTAEAFNNLGSTYFQMKQVDAAIGSYKTALELDPDFALARENLNAVMAVSTQPRQE